jgi:hypothetical protein
VPFLITTELYRPNTEEVSVYGGTVATATLDGKDVWNAFYETSLQGNDRAVEAISKLPDAGGTIDLPDGTRITVEPVKWSWLCGMVGSGGSSHEPHVWQPEILTRYNQKNNTPT